MSPSLGTPILSLIKVSCLKLDINDPSTAAIVAAVEGAREKHGSGVNQLPFVCVVGTTVTVRALPAFMDTHRRAIRCLFFVFVGLCLSVSVYLFVVA
jgi:hypothetical protein